MTLAMVPFDRGFPEIGERDLGVIGVTDRTDAVSTFVFRELYCTQPGCDCRRVLLHVHCIEADAVAASLIYAFDQPKQRGERQMFLDRMNPQSADADALLEVFREMIG